MLGAFANLPGAFLRGRMLSHFFLINYIVEVLDNQLGTLELGFVFGLHDPIIQKQDFSFPSKQYDAPCCNELHCFENSYMQKDARICARGSEFLLV